MPRLRLFLLQSRDYSSGQSRCPQYNGSSGAVEKRFPLHLALAEASRADYFCTCDDQLVRRAKRINDLGVKIIPPLDLIQEIEK